MANIAITNKNYCELIVKSKILQLIKQISLVTQNNKLLIEIVIFFNNLITNSTEENFGFIFLAEPFRSFENLLKSTRIEEGIYFSLSGIFELLKKIEWVKKEQICWLDVIITSLLPKIESSCLSENKKTAEKANLLLDKYNEVFNLTNLNFVEMETEN